MITSVPFSVVAAVLGMVLGFSGLDQDQAARQAREMMVRAPDGWYLSIRSDGSATYGYGSNVGTPIAAGTFDLNGTVASLQGRLREDGRVGQDYVVSIWFDESQLAESRYAGESPVIERLFAKAREASQEATTRVVIENENPVLFREALDADRQILVVRGRNLRVGSLSNLISEQLMEQATCAYPVRIELHVTEQPPVVIASRLRIETLPPVIGVAALDVLAEPGQIVVAVIEGENLAIWTVQVGSDKPPTWTVLPPHEWSVAGPLQPLDPQQIRVHLTRNADGRIKAEVTDVRRDAARPTVYEQVDDQWELVVP